MHTNARDEALALPTEASALLALRTQQIVACESGVTNTWIRWEGPTTSRTSRMRSSTAREEYLKKIEALGGVLRAIETGYVQREIQESAYEYQQNIEWGQQVVVGVNRYQEDSAAPRPFLRIDPEMERAQVDRLRGLRERRDIASRLP